MPFSCFFSPPPEVNLVVNCQNVFPSTSPTSPHKFCLCVGGPLEFNSTTLEFEDDVQLKCTCYPPLSAGRDARAADVGIDKECVGTVPRIFGGTDEGRKRRETWETKSAKKVSAFGGVWSGGGCNACLELNGNRDVVRGTRDKRF